MGYYVAKDVVQAKRKVSYALKIFFILKARETHGDVYSESRDQFSFERITLTTV